MHIFHSTWRYRWYLALVVMSWAILLLSPISANAQRDIHVGKMTLNNGGGAAFGGRFSLNASVGQPDAGQLQGGDFRVVGGFWTPLGPGTTGEPGGFSLRLPIIQQSLEDTQ